MISFSTVTKSAGKREILKGISFHISPGDRIGLVGVNGAGKTTIFRLILGKDTPESGNVLISKHIRIGYLPQDVLELRGKSVLEQVMDISPELEKIKLELEEINNTLSRPLPEREMLAYAERQSHLLEEFNRLGGYNLESRALKILHGLGFDSRRISQSVETLSGGWIMRVALARILLAEPDCLLLDEPTNHLDMESLLWFEEYLASFSGAFILVSHDRILLNNVAKRIFELENGTLYVHEGNYDFYETKKEERINRILSEYKTYQAKVRQIEEFIARNRSRKDRARQVQSRLKMLENMPKIELPTSSKSICFELPIPKRGPQTLVKLIDIQKRFSDKTVLRDTSFSVERGDRIAFLGPNGSGKSTLLKMLAGIISPDSGTVKISSNVEIGYYSQHQLENLNPENTVLEEVSRVAGDVARGMLRSLLGAFMFPGDDVFKLVKVLSGGEKSRLALCKLLLLKPNLLLLDEPTNHLDIPSRDILEMALQKYEGTLCLITHDRHFIDSVANKILVLNNGHAELFPGNCSDYQNVWRTRINDKKRKTRQKNTKKNGGSFSLTRIYKKEQKRREAQLRNELYKKKKPFVERLGALEQELETLDEKFDELNHKLSLQEIYAQPDTFRELHREYLKTKALIEKLTEEWEETALKIEEMEQAFNME